MTFIPETRRAARTISVIIKGKFRSRVVVMVMAFKATFNNISLISWRSVLLVEET
jgi:hypothetical protein